MATAPSDPKKSGELSFKQAGIGLVICAAVIIGAELASGSSWEWGSIPVRYVAGLFGIAGVGLAIFGLVKKV
jgi:hypothetical protein